MGKHSDVRQSRSESGGHFCSDRSDAKQGDADGRHYHAGDDYRADDVHQEHYRAAAAYDSVVRTNIIWRPKSDHSYRRNNELADLGNVINEMASNLQEIILLSQRMCAGGKRYIQEVIGYLDEEPLTEEKTLQMKVAVEKIREDLAMLEEVIAYFNFYSVDRNHHDG